MSDKLLTPLKKIDDTYLRGSEYRSYEVSQTNQELRKQRDELLSEISKLSDVYFGLKDGSDRMRSDMVGFQEDRVTTLEELGKKVSVSLENESSLLKEKARELDDTEVFLEELFEYTEELLNIATELGTGYEEKTRDLEEKLQTTTAKESELKKLLLEAQKEKEESTKLLEETKQKHQKTEELLTKVSDGTKQKELNIKREREKLEIERNEILNIKMMYKQKEQRLKDKEKEYGTRLRLLEKAEKRMI